jgi:DNA-binding transcriptional LysR family regulator
VRRATVRTRRSCRAGWSEIDLARRRSIALVDAIDEVVGDICLAADPGRLNLKVLVEIDSMETVRAMIMAGRGYTIAPETALLEDIREGRLQANRLALPGRERRLVLATRTDNADLPLVRQVSRIVRQTVKQTMLAGTPPD